MLRIALLTVILLFLALSMLYRIRRLFQALQTGKWSMRGSEVQLVAQPKVYWRIVIMNGVTLAISLCAAVVVIHAMGMAAEWRAARKAGCGAGAAAYTPRPSGPPWPAQLRHRAAWAPARRSPSLWAVAPTGRPSRRRPIRLDVLGVAQRGQGGLRPPHARPHGGLRQGGQGRRLQGDHRRGRRRRAPAGHDRLHDRAAGAGRAGQIARRWTAWIPCCPSPRCPAASRWRPWPSARPARGTPGLLAAQILALADAALDERVAAWRAAPDRGGGRDGGGC